MLSLIIPTYNERNSIEPLLGKVAEALRSYDYEVIVVDDDSPDLTWQAVEKMSSRDSRIRLVRRIGKRGLSSAVLEGFRQAKGDILGVMDADGSHDAFLLPKMIDLIERGEADCVVGSRRIVGGGADRWPWHRRVCSNLATFLACAFTNVSIKDPMSGFFCLSREVYWGHFESLKPRGYKILLEILVKALPKKVLELPYMFVDRKQDYSKLSVKVGMAYCLQLIELLVYRLRLVGNIIA